MGLFGTLGSVGGGVVGGMFGGPAGAAAGAAAGGYLGNELDPKENVPQSAIAPAILAQQNQLAQQLQLQSQGLGPNPAMQQMQMANDQNIRQNAGFIASQKGINPALAARLAAQNQAMMSQKNAADMGLISANQQLQSQQVLGGLLAGQQTENLDNQRIQLQNQFENNKRKDAVFGGLVNGIGGFAGQEYVRRQNQNQNVNTQQNDNAYEDSRMQGFAHGGPVVPGKAQTPGDSAKNDTVPAMLSPGEIVIPRSHAKNPELAKKFIDKLHASKPKETDEIDVAEIMKANKMLKKRIDALEKKVGK